MTEQGFDVGVFIPLLWKPTLNGSILWGEDEHDAPGFYIVSVLGVELAVNPGEYKFEISNPYIFTHRVECQAGSKWAKDFEHLGRAIEAQTMTVTVEDVAGVLRRMQGDQ